MENYTTGWIIDETDDRDYFLETVISQLPPQEIETQGKNIKLERAIFAEDDDSPILKRALRLVPEAEWKAKRHRYNQPSYLLLPLVKNKKKKRYKDHLCSLQNKDLFLPESVDLREWFSAIKNQEDVPACTACAAVALMEYFHNRMNGNLKKTSDVKDKNNSSESENENTSPESKDKKPDPKLEDESSNLSWLFLYKITTKLIEDKKDNGASIRDTLKAMALFGIPPEKYWSYDDQKPPEVVSKKDKTKSDLKLEQEPSAFCYAYAQNYQATHYFKLDRLEEYKKYQADLSTQNKDDLLKKMNPRELLLVRIRIALASGFPSIFGFIEPEILEKNITNNEKTENKNNEVIKNKKKVGQIDIVKIDDFNQENKNTKKLGHALVAVGYDDNMEFENPDKSKEPLKGAFLVRNSWGVDTWGDKGYGWLPYYYVEQGLATDWWSLLNAEWIDFSGFGLDINESGSGLLRNINCSCCGKPWEKARCCQKNC